MHWNTYFSKALRKINTHNRMTRHGDQERGDLLCHQKEPIVGLNKWEENNTKDSSQSEYAGEISGHDC